MDVEFTTWALCHALASELMDTYKKWRDDGEHLATKSEVEQIAGLKMVGHTYSHEMRNGSNAKMILHITNRRLMLLKS